MRQGARRSASGNTLRVTAALRRFFCSARKRGAAMQRFAPETRLCRACAPAARPAAAAWRGRPLCGTFSGWPRAPSNAPARRSPRRPTPRPRGALAPLRATRQRRKAGRAVLKAHQGRAPLRARALQEAGPPPRLQPAAATHAVPRQASRRKATPLGEQGKLASRGRDAPERRDPLPPSGTAHARVAQDVWHHGRLRHCHQGLTGGEAAG